jgi:hypothetical protein
MVTAPADDPDAQGVTLRGVGPGGGEPRAGPARRNPGERCLWWVDLLG